MKAIKEILKQYHKVENAYIIANSEIGVLSRMVSDALGEELTADMCDGGEIEFRRDEYEEITLRIEDIIRLLEEKK